MGIRITNKKELERLIAKGMVSQSDAVSSLKVLKSQKDIKCTRNVSSLISVCEMVPANPADILYQALVRKYGRFFEGGHVVYELEFSFDARRWRMDIALPIFKLALELDGWVDHGKRLSGFKRDREKSLCFERRGWRVVHFSSSQVKYELDETLKAIGEIMVHCSCQSAELFEIRAVKFDRSLYIETR